MTYQLIASSVGTRTHYRVWPLRTIAQNPLHPFTSALAQVVTRGCSQDQYRGESAAHSSVHSMQRGIGFVYKAL